MNVTQAMQSRRTIRGFKPDPVPAEVIRENIFYCTRESI